MSTDSQAAEVVAVVQVQEQVQEQAQEQVQEQVQEDRENDVDLICVAEGSKLRVRILTQGYLNTANVQFPRALRQLGRRFRVHRGNIHLITTRGKYFYSVKHGITILDDSAAYIPPSRPSIRPPTKLFNKPSNAAATAAAAAAAPEHIYEDVECNECVVCLATEKNTVFGPCGHYYCCNVCATKLTTCPICRQRITARINKSLLD